MYPGLQRLAGPIDLWLVFASLAAPAAGQVDQQLAAKYFEEAQTLCEREAGRLWGVSLCGPMVFADAQTKTIATNRPAPEADRPRALGYANAAMKWGEERWSTYIWKMIPADDERGRAELILHELFHRVQPELGLMTRNGQNDHLDTSEGRYWLQLEWRALAQALQTSGPERTAAVRDALAFRVKRRTVFPEAAENERVEEIREGLAQYTGTVAAAEDVEDAVASALDQLAEAPRKPTFVRSFGYTSGMAYGLLLDAWSPGWTRQVEATDDLAELVREAAGIESTEKAEDAAARYGGAELWAAEEKREAERKARVAELRRRFVEGPVLVMPRGSGASFITTGATPIPGAGTVLAKYRLTAEWGRLEADKILVSDDGETLVVPAPAELEGTELTGDGWTVELAPGWAVRPGPRSGDFRVVREGSHQGSGRRR